jgi:lipid-binding SYLF domain-containing protein
MLANDKKEQDRLENCGLVIQEIMDIPDDIPQDLIDKADCIIVYPSVLKGAFIFGGSYGRGAMTCRSGEKFNGPWSAPTMMALEGGSFGFQIGGQATDFVLLVMNERGAKAILSSKVKLGADASAAAGPKGRSAEASTDVTMRAEILSYSRARGLFAGVSLSGSTVRPDNRANEKLYNKSVSAGTDGRAENDRLPQQEIPQKQVFRQGILKTSQSRMGGTGPGEKAKARFFWLDRFGYVTYGHI